MKKITVIILAAIGVMMASPSHAILRNDLAVAKGKVISYQRNSGQVTMDDVRSASRLHLNVKGANVYTTIKEGEVIHVVYEKKTRKAKSVRPPKK